MGKLGWPRQGWVLCRPNADCFPADGIPAASAAGAGRAALPAAARSATPSACLARAATEGLACPSRRALTFRAAARGGSQGALELAALEEGRAAPRSKLCALRLRWLRSWLHRPSKGTEAGSASAALQKAGTPAKQLSPSSPEASRRLPAGWQPPSGSEGALRGSKPALALLSLQPASAAAAVPASLLLQIGRAHV